VPQWPKLKTLALYHCYLDAEDFWKDMGKMENLETLVLARPLGAGERKFKREWSACGNGEKRVTVWFVNMDGQVMPNMIEEPKEDDIVTIMAGRIPTTHYENEHFGKSCQKWIKGLALRGENWFQEGLRNLIM
jgi:hypothetical protein